MAEIKYIIPFTYKWEGGLTSNVKDTASKYPSPWMYNGAPAHTNKGITYKTFEAGAKKYGFTNNQDTFFKMPEDVWLKIAKGMYWDVLHLDEVKSQAVANIMFSWIWGSGYAWRPRIQRYFASKGITWNINDFKAMAEAFNTLTAKEGEKKIFDELIEQKKQFLLSLNQPAFEKGWMNRLADLQKYSYSLLGSAATATIDFAKKNPLITIAITATLLISGYILYTQITKKK